MFLSSIIFRNTKSLRSADALTSLKKPFPASYRSLSKANNLKEERPLEGLNLSNPKGTKDYGPSEMVVREKVMEIVKSCFRKHGAVPIDTPIFEFKSILMQKYGEEQKKIFEIKHEGKEEVALRYDLTVPLTRYLAMNKISLMKCYHIAKVYRRDEPIMSRGRFCEFYQCDFDITGSHDHMTADAECIRVIWEVLSQLDLGDFIIKVNDRRVLDGIFTICGCPSSHFQSVASAIDKFDKISWNEVRNTIISSGVDKEVADKIGTFVKLKGNEELLESLLGNSNLCTIPSAYEGLIDLKTLFEYLKIYNVSHQVNFDLSLSRGLTYYTGVMYEAVLVDSNSKRNELTKVGSVAGGGRYDDMVADLNPNGNSIPCVGLSIGLERIFSIIQSKMEKTKKRINQIEVYVASPKSGLLTEKMKLLETLWSAGIKAKMSHNDRSKLLTQFQECEQEGIPFALIVGPKEIEEGVVIIRDVVERKDVKVEINSLLDEVQQRLR